MKENLKQINLGGVNCFLLKAGDGFILVDTGMAGKRSDLETALQAAGCQPGNLKLILLTHGDADHIENSTYLRDKYGAKIAIHDLDAGMIENSDMSWNRKKKPDKLSFLGGMVIFLGGLFNRNTNPERFTPDYKIQEGFDLQNFGVDAAVLHLPGHSKGSIGILTADGDLICGDLFWNLRKPTRHFLISDLSDYQSSLEKIRQNPVRMIYPGHGKPFKLEQMPA